MRLSCEVGDGTEPVTCLLCCLGSIELCLSHCVMFSTALNLDDKLFLQFELSSICELESVGISLERSFCLASRIPGS